MADGAAQQLEDAEPLRLSDAPGLELLAARAVAEARLSFEDERADAAGGERAAGGDDQVGEVVR